ncbi:MAG: FHA domain-containing protein [Actinomycetota bacterium]
MRCVRCAHANPDSARFCSSCGAVLGPAVGEESTLTLAAVTHSDEEDELARDLEELPLGVGLLVVRSGPDVGSSFRIDSESTAIGRHPASDLFLDDVTVSRRHVVLERGADGFRLRDAGSLNGTYVNRRRVDEARLDSGDEVQIGRYRLTFLVGGRAG